MEPLAKTNSAILAGSCARPRMLLLDLTLPTLAENLALDEALLLDAEAGGPEVMRFWEWPSHAVVIGAGGKWSEETQSPRCARDDVPILRRSSGGGAVVVGPGCLLFSLVLSFQREPVLADLHSSYRLILNQCARGLAGLAPGIEPAGISDLAIAGRKCSGSSQQRKRTHLLHHGTLLCSFDLTALPRYLAHPPREPEYRRQRPHLDFVTNLGVPTDDAKRALADAWGVTAIQLIGPSAGVQRLVTEKYGVAEWHRRR